MGLQIQFIDKRGGARRQVSPVGGPTGPKRFELSEEQGDWLALEVNLVPVKELPVVVRVEFQVLGTPEVVAARLGAAYPSRRFNNLQVSEPVAVAAGRVPNANPLPHQVLCELRVTVFYHDA